jgi:virulence-associated protein VapD
MFAIAFDMSISKLKENFGEPYNNAYFEIKKEMQKCNFYNMQGSIYLTQNNDMANLFKAINGLKEIEWFRKSVRDIRAFRVEDWSDFTGLFVQDEK